MYRHTLVQTNHGPTRLPTTDFHSVTSYTGLRTGGGPWELIYDVIKVQMSSARCNLPCVLHVNLPTQRGMAWMGSHVLRNLSTRFGLIVGPVSSACVSIRIYCAQLNDWWFESRLALVSLLVCRAPDFTVHTWVIAIWVQAGTILVSQLEYYSKVELDVPTHS